MSAEPLGKLLASKFSGIDPWCNGASGEPRDFVEINIDTGQRPDCCRGKSTQATSTLPSKGSEDRKELQHD